MLAVYVPGAPVVDVLAPKAAITMMLDEEHEWIAVPVPGSARCARRWCRLIGRA